jgi:hypothetical protein
MESNGLCLLFNSLNNTQIEIIKDNKVIACFAACFHSIECCTIPY